MNDSKDEHVSLTFQLALLVKDKICGNVYKQIIYMEMPSEIERRTSARRGKGKAKTPQKCETLSMLEPVAFQKEALAVTRRFGVITVVGIDQNDVEHRVRENQCHRFGVP